MVQCITYKDWAQDDSFDRDDDDDDGYGDSDSGDDEAQDSSRNKLHWSTPRNPHFKKVGDARLYMYMHSVRCK
jgi:hypothetical protein